MFEFVYVDYLSIDHVQNFASFVSDNLLEKISSGIWGRICRRYVLETKPNEKNPHNCTGHSLRFVYHESKKLDGVIAHLTRECDGNVHEKGIVNVTASTVYGSSYHTKDAVDLGTDPRY